MASVSSNDLPDGGGTPSYTALPLISRTKHVRDQLEAAIERGDYAPGARLPSERELAELLGVSRVSVREAIRSLEAIGVVEVQHGRGCFVATSRSDRYTSSFSHWLSVHRDEVLELLKVRGALDELAAETAAKEAAPEWPARLRELNARFRRVDPQDMDALVDCDVAFHDGIAEASGSTLLADLLRELHETLNESRRATLLPPGRPAESAREHDAIIDAIARHDPKGARRAVAAHLESVRAALTTVLETSDTEVNA